MTILSFKKFNPVGQILKVEPPFWWTDMKNDMLQLMIYGNGIANLEIRISKPGIKVLKVHQTDNVNYLFVDLQISTDAKPGIYNIEFLSSVPSVHTFPYTLKKRASESQARKGFDNSDVIYLIMPDRFANGDSANDILPELHDGLNRKSLYGRRGGDLKGIIENLDYIAKMGFSALWLNPVLENNQYRLSYHGYAITDFYRIDPRLGTNEEYAELSQVAASKGVKLIKDVVLNHCGSEHWWMKDVPNHDWINFYPRKVITNHRRTIHQDPYASYIDGVRMTDGWFVARMPDLNQRNPLLATYLIQNAIWWIEFAGLSGLRVDTYPYSDKYFMAKWNKSILSEYPYLNIVGEEWSANPAIVSYWQKGSKLRENYETYLPSLMDFPLQAALKDSMLEKEGPEKGLNKIYYALVNDFLYPNPFNLVTFADNHDMSRFFVQVNKNINLYKLAIVFILTTRGIPQIFYGSEVLMTHKKNDGHGGIREEFPGGWPDHKTNAFTGQGLSSLQLSTQDFFRKLLNWRKNSPQIHSGAMIHFAPEKGVYVYFRHNQEKTTMVVLNKNSKTTTLSTRRFKEAIKDNEVGFEIITGKTLDLKSKIILPPFTPMIIDIINFLN